MQLPDIASTTVQGGAQTRLDWVGMESILLPIQILDSKGQIHRAPAEIKAFVDLVDAKSRGIHMSRLYSTLQKGFAEFPMTNQLLEKMVDEFLLSHQLISSSARIEVSFSALVEKESLKSQQTAWRTYPVTYRIEKKRGETAQIFLKLEVVYSSTCPASAALARQLIQTQFNASVIQLSSEGILQPAKVSEFLGSTQGIVATPHAQRSIASIEAQVRGDYDHFQLIDLIEEALGTPVQTIVKREDEQEFARLNAENLMFCEDAARKIISHLQGENRIFDFSGKVSHQESLHPHNAVTYFRKQKGSNL